MPAARLAHAWVRCPDRPPRIPLWTALHPRDVAFDLCAVNGLVFGESLDTLSHGQPYLVSTVTHVNNREPFPFRWSQCPETSEQGHPLLGEPGEGLRERQCVVAGSFHSRPWRLVSPSWFVFIQHASNLLAINVGRRTNMPEDVVW